MRNGLALIRVPTPTVAVADFMADLKSVASVKELNAAFKEAGRGR